MSSVALTFSAPSSLVLCAFLFVFSAHWCRLSEKKEIYFSQTIAPSVVVPFASEFDDIMRETNMKVADIEHINDEQKVQLSFPTQIK